MDEKITVMLSLCHVNDWAQYNDKLMFFVKRNNDGSFILSEDKFTIKNTGSPDTGYSLGCVRRGKPKTLKFIKPNSDWCHVLELNDLFHRTYLMDKETSPLIYKKLVNECKENLLFLENYSFVENGTKDAFNLIKRSLESNILEQEYA